MCKDSAPIETLPAPLDPLTITHVRGLGILAFRATTLAGLTLEMQGLLMEKLSPEAIELMRRTPGIEEWVPVAHLTEIRRVYTQLFGTRLEKVRGFTLASLMFSHPMFEDLRNAHNISLFLARFPRLWENTHKGGRIEIAHLSANQARITIQAHFPNPQYLEEILPLAFQETLSLLGFSDGRVNHRSPQSTKCAGTHLYDLTWNP